MTYLLDTLVWSAVWGISSAAVVSALIDYHRHKNQGRNHGR